MAQLTVRNVPENVVRALKLRAARHGRSAESEHRIVLAQALNVWNGEFRSQADACRSAMRRQRSDSGVLQRESRTER